MPDLDEIRENFEFFDDWEDRYRYLIDLGRDLPDMPDVDKNDANKVRGCQSQVWLVAQRDADGLYHFLGDSDAHIVRGLVALVIALFSGKDAAAIQDTDARGLFADLGLSSHLSPMRANGLFSMVARIQAMADAG